MKKRLISGIVSAMVFISSALSTDCFNAFVKYDQADDVSQTSEYSIKGENSLGKYMERLSQDNTLNEEVTKPGMLSAEATDSGYRVTNFTFDAQTGKLRAVSSQPCESKLVFRFVEDGETATAFKVETKVQGGECVVTEEIADISRLPEYYTVSAQLYNALGRPVGNEFKVTEYTKDIQDVLKASTEDFEEDRVVNLDESEKTNFLVLSEDTIYVESSENCNVIASADYDNDNYVIDLADDTLKNLKKGDKVYITDYVHEIIAVNVEKVKVDGDTVTINGNDEIDDMFAFIKIQTSSETDKTELDINVEDGEVVEEKPSENMEELVIPDDLAESFSGNKNAESSADEKLRVGFERKFKYPPDSTSTTPDQGTNSEDSLVPNLSGIKLDPNLKLFLQGTIGLYLNFHFYTSMTGKTEFEAEFEVNFIGRAEANASLTFTVPFLDLYMPTGITGIYAVLQPKFTIKAEARAVLSINYKPLVGVRISSDDGFEGYHEIFKDQKGNSKFHINENSELTFEGKVTIEFSAGVNLHVINDKVFTAGLTLGCGAIFEVKKLTTPLTSINPSADSEHTANYEAIKCSSTDENVHSCDFCATIEPSAYIRLTVKLEIFRKKILNGNDLEVRFTIKLSDLIFHVSKLKGKSLSLGWGECTNAKYRAQFNIYDAATGRFVSEADVQVKPSGSSKSISLKRNASLVGRCYCDNGRYTATVLYGDKVVKSFDFTINNASYEYNLTLDLKEDENGNQTVETGPGNAATGTTTVTTKATTQTIDPAVTSTGKVKIKTKMLEQVNLGDNISGILYNNGELKVSGYGDMYDFSGSPLKQRSSVQTVIFEEPEADEGKYITNIGSHVFDGCVNLATAYISNSIKSIGDYAFNGCTSLKYFRYSYDATNTTTPLPSALESIGNYAFAGCESLKAITVPSTVKSVGDYAFSRCISLKNATVRKGVEYIGYYVFDKCYSLENVTLPYAGHSADLKADSDSLSYTMFTNGYNSDKEFCVYNGAWSIYSVPQTLKTIKITGGTIIPNKAFINMKGVTTIILASSITEICSEAMRGCSSLETFPLESIETIGDYAFYECTSAVYDPYTFPEAVKTIGNYAFAGCEGLKKIIVPGTVESTGDYIFSRCTGLKNAIIKDGVEYIGNYVFDKCYELENVTLPYAGHSLDLAADSDSLSYTMFTNGYNSDKEFCVYNGAWSTYSVPQTLKSIKITGGTIIPSKAFINMKGLTTVTLASSITEICSEAMRGCSSLEKFPLKSVETIGDYAFYECTSAVYDPYTFPAAVKTIGNYAFGGCTGLKKVIVPGTIESTGDYVFSQCTSLKNVIVKDGVGSIGYYIFDKCSALENVTLPYAGHSLDLAANSDSVAYTLFTNGYDADKEYCVYNGAWSIYSVPKTLKSITITGGALIPNYAFINMQGLTTINLADSITEICSESMRGCSSLKKFPLASVEKIGSSAFYECTGAAYNSYTLPAAVKTIGNYAFEGCTGLKKVIVPGTVESIGDYAFKRCTGMKNAIIKDGVGSIGYYIFDKCSALENVTLPYAGHSLDLAANSDSVAYSLFSNGYDAQKEYCVYNGAWSTYAVPKTLTSITITGGALIPNYAFINMEGLTTINLADSIKTIGSEAMRGCSSLEKFPLESVETIGNSAFYECTGAIFSSYTFPAAVKTIGNYAFEGCTGLKKVIVPGTVDSIGDYVFTRCTNMKNVMIEDGVGSIGYYIFDKCYALENVTLPYAGHSLDLASNSDSVAYSLFTNGYNNGKEYCVYNGAWSTYSVPRTLKSITITGGTLIPNNAFMNMQGLTTINLASSIKTIGNEAMRGCSSLEKFPLASIETIGISAFYECTGAVYDSYTLPAAVKTIGNYAFEGCTGIKEIVVPKTVTTIGDYVFTRCTGMKNAIIKDGVGSIGYYIFDKCSALESVTLPYAGHSLDLAVNSDSLAYSMFTNGHNKDTEYCVYSGAWSTYSVPMTLRSITITGGTIIPNNAFINIVGLTEVTLPASLTTVGTSAFSGCSGLTDVYVTNGEADWEKVTINTGNEPLLNALKHFNAVRIMKQPSDITVIDGERTYFETCAAGCGLTYQWQFSADGGNKWSDLSKVNGSSCSFTVGMKHNGYLYRCVIKSKLGETFITDSAVLTVKSACIEGDANGDGVIDEDDVSVLIRWLLGDPNAQITNWESLDLCKDGIINVFDLVMLKKMIISGTPAPSRCPVIAEPEFTEETYETEEIQTAEEEMTEEIVEETPAEETEIPAEDELSETSETETETETAEVETEDEAVEAVETVEIIEIIEPAETAVVSE